MDITTNPCDVNITDVWIRHGGIVDAIQIQYNVTNGNQELKPLRGGSGGGLTHVAIPDGGKIIGIFGGITENTNTDYGVVITQLRILVLDENENLQIYGPFGTVFYDNPGTFAVYGDIKSIFGYHGHFLNGLGVYYEPWGVCGSPCA